MYEGVGGGLRRKGKWEGKIFEREMIGGVNVRGRVVRWGMLGIEKKRGSRSLDEEGKWEGGERGEKYMGGVIKDKNEVMWSGGL